MHKEIGIGASFGPNESASQLIGSDADSRGICRKLLLLKGVAVVDFPAGVGLKGPRF